MAQAGTGDLVLVRSLPGMLGWIRLVPIFGRVGLAIPRSALIQWIGQTGKDSAAGWCLARSSFGSGSFPRRRDGSADACARQ